MATIGCSEFLNQLEPWLEGERSPEGRAHLSGCPRCRNVVDDLGLIQSSARNWASDEPEPPARIWTSLRAQLEMEGLIRRPRRASKGWFVGWLPPAPRPALAGAYVAVLLALALGLSGPIRSHVNQERWRETALDTSSPLTAELDTAEATVAAFPKSNSPVTVSLRKNLAIVDNYITLCEKSVREEPENEMARDYLYDAYQQKADLLAQMSERGDDTR
ncbi:MAG: anti-sigma factor family protein [Candidatus Acidiferrales bacterium]